MSRENEVLGPSVVELAVAAKTREEKATAMKHFAKWREAIRLPTYTAVKDEEREAIFCRPEIFDAFAAWLLEHPKKERNPHTEEMEEVAR